jgi:hypothetical protein
MEISPYMQIGYFNCSAPGVLLAGSATAVESSLYNSANWVLDVSTTNSLSNLGGTAIWTPCSFNIAGSSGMGSPGGGLAGAPPVIKPMMGPCPQHSGQPVMFVLPRPPRGSQWWVYNLAGKPVASLNFGSVNVPSWRTTGVAAGIYRVRGKVSYADGNAYDGWSTVAIIP